MATKQHFPADMKEKKVLPILLYRCDIENIFLLEQDEQIAAQLAGRKARSAAEIYRDLAADEVARRKLRD